MHGLMKGQDRWRARTPFAVRPNVGEGESELKNRKLDITLELAWQGIRWVAEAALRRWADEQFHRHGPEHSIDTLELAAVDVGSNDQSG